MNKLLATLVASTAFIGAAYAGEAQGTIASVDPATRTVVLEDGSSYVAAEGVALDALTAGANVTVTFDDGTTNATAIELAE